MSYCGICGDDDHGEAACELRLGAPFPDQSGLLPQHKRCRTCQQITHAWDHHPCGRHTIPGQEMTRVDLPPRTPARPVRDHQALALAQVQEARAERGTDLDAWWDKAMDRERQEIRLPAPDRREDQHVNQPEREPERQREAH